MTRHNCNNHITTVTVIPIDGTQSVVRRRNGKFWKAAAESYLTRIRPESDPYCIQIGPKKGSFHLSRHKGLQGQAKARRGHLRPTPLCKKGPFSILGWNLHFCKWRGRVGTERLDRGVRARRLHGHVGNHPRRRVVSILKAASVITTGHQNVINYFEAFL